MANVHGKFDVSDTPEPEGLQPLESSSTPESAESLEELESRLESEGLETVHEMFRSKIDEESEAFGAETVKTTKNIEERYDATLDTDASKELQELLANEENLRERVKTDMQAVVEDRYTPNTEQQSIHAELRAKRDNLDKQWELLSETVALEGANDSEMMKHALKTGEMPPLSDAGKRLNEVLKEIFAIDQKLAALPRQKPEAAQEAAPEGTDENPILLTKDMEKPRATPPPPPGSEGRAAWLQSKIDAETDPVKKAELTMQALDEKHGSTETPETKPETPVQAVPEALPVQEEKPDGNTAEQWQALYPNEDFVSSDKPKEPVETPAEAPPESVPEKPVVQTETPVETPAASPVETPPEEGGQASDEELMSFVADKEEKPEKTQEVSSSEAVEKKILDELSGGSEKLITNLKKDFYPEEWAARGESQLAEFRDFGKAFSTVETMKTVLVEDGLLSAEDIAAMDAKTLVAMHARLKDGFDKELSILEKSVAGLAEDARHKVIDDIENSEIGKTANEVTEGVKFLLDNLEKGVVSSEGAPMMLEELKALHANFATKESFISALKKDKGGLDALVPRLAALTDSDIEGILQGHREAIQDGIEAIENAIPETPEADLQEAMQAEVAEAITEDENPEAPITHSERHAMNAEAFGNLVTDLETHIDALHSNEVDISGIKDTKQLLEELRKAGILTDDDVSGFDGDHMRRNVLWTKFNKLKSAKK